jgi:dolichol-phosphate mannosyltransferase
MAGKKMDLERHESFSIIIPTFHEAENLPELAKRIASVDFGNRTFEVILVDDNSQDGTPAVAKELALNYPWLKCISRQKPRNLSGSIIDGCHAAIYPVLITMDADLSHPPEKISAMLEILTDPRVDAVIGSRYVNGGSSDPSWPQSRVFTSRLGALIARICLFTNIKDPLSGFLAIRKKTFLSAAHLNTIGWKIGLEIMVKCRCKVVREIPIHFAQRKYGYSKLTLAISTAYLFHVLNLMWYKIAGNYAK